MNMAANDSLESNLKMFRRDETLLLGPEQDLSGHGPNWRNEGNPFFPQIHPG